MSFESELQHLINVGMWPTDRKTASLWHVIATWVNSQQWEETNADKLVQEINEALARKGITEYKVKQPLHGCFVHEKMTVNGHILVFE